MSTTHETTLGSAEPGGADAGEEPGGLWAPGRRALTAGLTLSMTFIAFEALAVIAIMPTVARELGGLDLYGWVFSAFMLASLVGTVAAGIDADRHGLVRPYLAGLALFAAGLAVDALAPSMPVLVGGRVLQGLGAGAEPAVAYIAIGRALPEALRARMMAVLSTAWVVPGLLAPALSVAIAHVAGWRWVFAALIPLVALAGGLAFRALARLGAPAARAHTESHRLRDALLVAGGCALLLAGVGRGSALAAVALAGGGAVLALPALRRLLPPRTLSAGRGLPATILLMGLLNFAFFGGDAFVPLAVTSVLHRSTAAAGLIVTASTIAWTAGSWLQARTEGSRRQGRTLVRAGLALMLTGLAGVALSLQGGGSIALAAAAWSLSGFGIGLAYSPLSLMMLREAPSGRAGWASASLTISEVLGIALGTGLAGAAVAAGQRLGWSAAAGLLAAFGIAAAGGIVALALAGRLPAGPRR